MKETPGVTKKYRSDQEIVLIQNGGWYIGTKRTLQNKKPLRQITKAVEAHVQEKESGPGL